MSGLSGRQSRTSPGESFPKTARILQSADFRKVYDEGWRYTCPFFTAFCLPSNSGQSPRFGFTLPRALGKATVRNRIKRRIREMVRRMQPEFPPGIWIVMNPRKAAYDAPAAAIRRELERLAARCRR